MKSTGLVRHIDELGRIVIPKDLRNMFQLKEGDALEIAIDGSNIVLCRRYTNARVEAELNALEESISKTDGLRCRPQIQQKLNELKKMIEG